MTLRTRFAIAFAAVASLLKVNTEQTFRALVDAMDTRRGGSS